MLMRTPSQSLTVQLAARFAERICSRKGWWFRAKTVVFLCVMLRLIRKTGPQPNQNLRNQLLI